jgi:hypothetical protein
MRILSAVIASLAFLSLTPRPANAQTCCGELVGYWLSCPGNCGPAEVYSCNPGGGSTYMVEGIVQCGRGSSCQGIDEFIPAGYCYDGVLSSLAAVTQGAATTSDEGAIYVNAYVKLCNGRYVAARIEMARQAS